MPATIIDNALNTVGDSAPGRAFRLEPLDGPFYTVGGTVYTGGEAPIDPVTGLFTLSAPSTDVDIDQAGAAYRGHFLEYGSSIAHTKPFAMPDGSLGPLRSYITVPPLEEGQLSGRSLDYAEGDTPPASVNTTTPASFVPGLVIAPTVGVRPILLEAVVPLALAPVSGINFLRLSIFDTTDPTDPIEVARGSLSCGGPAQPLVARRRFSPPSGTRIYEAKMWQVATQAGSSVQTDGPDLFSLEAVER